MKYYGEIWGILSVTASVTAHGRFMVLFVKVHDCNLPRLCKDNLGEVVVKCSIIVLQKAPVVKAAY